MNIASEIVRALTDLEEACAISPASGPQTFTWRGSVEIPCVPNSLGRTVEIDPRGNAVAVDLKLFVRRQAFVTADSTLITVDSELFTADNDRPTPVAGRTVVFRGVTYRIVLATESPEKSHFVLGLADPAANI